MLLPCLGVPHRNKPFNAASGEPHHSVFRGKQDGSLRTALTGQPSQGLLAGLCSYLSHSSIQIISNLFHNETVVVDHF